MENRKVISGFSKLSKRGKLKWIVENFFKDPETVMKELMYYWLPREEEQKVIDGFSENTISNYILPYGVAPNFLINGQEYCIPMVIEESSVVAAASSAAKFWYDRGGFHAQVLDTHKVGQVHFKWTGPAGLLYGCLDRLRARLRADAAPITANMEQRGGGILDIELLDMTDQEPDYYQLRVSFETCDSMGANFINSVLEQFARSLQGFVLNDPDIPESGKDVRIIMSILSNYTPDCVAEAWVSCPVEALGTCEGIPAADFAGKFCTAVRIASVDPYRAVTHNKGIFNGIDAVILATANDFRAVESCAHAYAARDGQYRSLSYCTVEDGIFRFGLQVPLALGTVGGLTSLHPIARRSLELLGNPSARELMMIVAAAGLAQNFAAVRSLVTTGIQKGHMKMHLANMLHHLGASDQLQQEAITYFRDKAVSYSAVRAFVEGHSVAVNPPMP